MDLQIPFVDMSVHQQFKKASGYLTLLAALLGAVSVFSVRLQQQEKIISLEKANPLMRTSGATGIIGEAFHSPFDGGITTSDQNTGEISWQKEHDFPLQILTALNSEVDHPVRVLDDDLRLDLMEYLDRAVAYEQYFRSIHGYYTKILSKVGGAIPASLQRVYEVQVIEATRDRLLIRAFSEEYGKVSEWMTVDQSYQLRANFKLPLPRLETIRRAALTHLKQMTEQSSSYSVQDEAGLFRGYFKYEVRLDSMGKKSAFAVGQRPPVIGMQLDLSGVEIKAAEAMPQEHQRPWLSGIEDLSHYIGIQAIGVAGTVNTPEEIQKNMGMKSRNDQFTEREIVIEPIRNPSREPATQTQ